MCVCQGDKTHLPTQKQWLDLKPWQPLLQSNCHCSSSFLLFLLLPSSQQTPGSATVETPVKRPTVSSSNSNSSFLPSNPGPLGSAQWPGCTSVAGQSGAPTDFYSALVNEISNIAVGKCGGNELTPVYLACLTKVTKQRDRRACSADSFVPTVLFNFT